MEFWELSEPSIQALLRLRKKNRNGTHESAIHTLTFRFLSKHELIKSLSMYPKYWIISTKGREILKKGML